MLPIQPPPRGECFEFQEGGNCKYGDSCRFAHGEDDARPRNAPKQRRARNNDEGGEGGGGGRRGGGGGGGGGRSSGPRDNVCYNFRDNGECLHGESCRFKHGGKHTPQPPLFLFSHFIRPKRKENAKKTAHPRPSPRRYSLRLTILRWGGFPRPNVTFLSGTLLPCTLCGRRLHHADDDARDFNTPRNISDEVCRNYLKGRCRFGDACPRRHEGEVVPEALEQIAEVCKNFVEGRCRFGDHCRREHPSMLSTLHD